jgi:hypothetical protein
MTNAFLNNLKEILKTMIIIIIINAKIKNFP